MLPHAFMFCFSWARGCSAHLQGSFARQGLISSLRVHYSSLMPPAFSQGVPLEPCRHLLHSPCLHLTSRGLLWLLPAASQLPHLLQWSQYSATAKQRTPQWSQYNATPNRQLPTCCGLALLLQHRCVPRHVCHTTICLCRQPSCCELRVLT